MFYFILFYFILLLPNDSWSVQYWGWCKHQYRQVYKERFEQAKRTAYECLDACLVEVIRNFFNCSWQFMNTYCMGLTGKLAEWAVQQQKSHRQVIVAMV